MVERYFQLMQGVFLSLNPLVNPALLGSEQLVASLAGMVTSVSARNDQISFSPTFAATGRVFATYVTMQLGMGIDSWADAYMLLDPNGFDQSSGQANVGNMIQVLLQYMIDRNHGQSYFEFTRQVLQAVPTVANTQAIIISMWVSITSY